MKKYFFKKTISYVLLVAFCSGMFANLFIIPPKQAGAFILSGLIGGADENNPVIDQVAVEPTIGANAIIESANVAALNKAYSVELPLILSSLNDQAGITSQVLYNDALFQAKTANEVLTEVFPDADSALPTPSVPIPGDIANPSFENLPLVNGSKNQQEIINIAMAQSRDVVNRGNRTFQQQQAAQLAFQRQVQTILRGAITQFFSPIACGGVNVNAIRNAGVYLAAATTGAVANQITSQSGLGYYQGMARLGSPLAIPDFWGGVVFPDSAATLETKGRAGAALEVISPGLKTPQTFPTASGQGGIRSSGSVSGLTSAQSQALAGLLNVNLLSARSIAASFAAYDISVLANYVAGWVARLAAQGFGGQFLNFAFSAIIWKAGAKSAGAVISDYIVRAFVQKLFAQLIAQIFKGKILAESTGCRRPAKTADFKTTANPTSLTANGTTPTTQSDTKGVFFEIAGPKGVTSPSQTSIDITAGDQITLEWDATPLDDTNNPPRITINPLPQGCGPVLNISNSCSATPQQTTTYTLQVSSSQGDVSITRTVNVSPPPPPPSASQVAFDVTPTSGQAPLIVTVTWDASALGFVGVKITPQITGDAILPSKSPAGGIQYTVNESTTFTLTVVGNQGNVLTDGSGAPITKSVNVNVTLEPVPTQPPGCPPRARCGPVVQGAFTSSGFNVRE